MANRPVNDKQRRVLEWLSTGATQEPPEPDMKLSAAALKSRGLAKVTRLQGKWTCELTDLGKYYLEHGAYPPEPEKPATEPAPRSGRTVKKPKERAPKVPGPPSLTDEESSIRITKPHPAVRSLMDRPVALGADHDTRRRGIVAAHRLLRAAADAGFEIEGHLQPKKRSNDTPYRGERLVTLDAGHQKVIVNIGESMRRTPHVQTAQDKEHIAKWGYSSSSSYDYVSSNILCFRVYGTDVCGGNGAKLTETSRKPLTAFVYDVIELVRLGTQRSLDWQERRRQMEEESAREAAKARAVAERRAHYERWESVLD